MFRKIMDLRPDFAVLLVPILLKMIEEKPATQTQRVYVDGNTGDFFG